MNEYYFSFGSTISLHRFVEASRRAEEHLASRSGWANSTLQLFLVRRHRRDEPPLFMACFKPRRKYLHTPQYLTMHGTALQIVGSAKTGGANHVGEWQDAYALGLGSCRNTSFTSPVPRGSSNRFKTDMVAVSSSHTLSYRQLSDILAKTCTCCLAG